MPRPIVGTPIARSKRVEDLVQWEENPNYTRTAIPLTAGTYVIGQMVAASAASASCVGFQPTFAAVLLLENIVVPATKTYEVNCLVRGPALVNFDEVLRVGAETDAALKTRLAPMAAQGVRFVREPVKQSNPDLTA